ncbi:MFS transporter [Microbacterium karelineae]|uniref:MFS transporter n=1 Tax=Microbacterium karelineae TaxID=2654283 RepID=UPI0018D2BE0B|nr:glycoside-pentoside-hexuronide (GPH):cation symporter [Microbacterium karelineae]
MNRPQQTTLTRALSTARPFGWRDRVGYLFGDLGNDFLFLLASSYLMVYFTDVAGLQAGHVGLLFLLTRLLDAFTDVGWGRFLDAHRPSPNGRFRPWILRAAVPLAVMSALMYAPFVAEWAYGAKLTYAVVTYVLWGSVFYTMVNISYGSLAAVITPDPGQRSSLSVFRGIGANIAGIFVALVPPLVIYGTVDGVSTVRPGAFFGIGIAFAAAAVVYYAFCYRLTSERVKAEPRERASFATLLRSLATNRALIALMGSNLILMLAGLLVNAMAAYLWLNHFNNGALSGPAQLASFLPGLVLAPFAAAVARRIGKREFIAGMLLVSAAVFLLMFLLHVTSPWAFIVLSVVAGFGVGTYNLLVWALIADVVDYEEVRTGERDDGTVYAINTWARKLGFALAGGAGGIALGIVGYQEGGVQQSAATIDGIYAISTLVPAVLYGVAAVMLLTWYPLSRRRVADNVDVLAARHADRAAPTEG